MVVLCRGYIYIFVYLYMHISVFDYSLYIYMCVYQDLAISVSFQFVEAMDATMIYRRLLG